MGISFCIPAHNEECVIGATLDALHAAGAASGRGYEIVVADDGSTDGTAAVARARGARVVEIDRRQIAAARNAAARASSGDILIFVDADTLVPVEVVRAACGAIEKGAAGGGAGVLMDGWVPRYARVMLVAVNAIFRLMRLTGGCFVFCTRGAFEACGGWDETLFVSEELAFARAVKRACGWRRFVIVPGRVVTSGRKLRAYSGLEIVGVFGRAAWSPVKAPRRREGLELWYGPRRADPGGTMGGAGHSQKLSDR